MDRKLRSRQMITAAALALAATGAFALGAHQDTDSSTSSNDSATASHERANPTANGNEASANSQASEPRTQKDEDRDWNAAPAGSKAKAATSGKRYDGYDSTEPGKNNSDEPTSQPSSGGGGNQASGGQG